MKPIEVAGCIILDEYNRILLMHRFDAPEPHWELPGGTVEEGETAEAAAVRELKEELDLDVQLIGSLGSEIVEDEAADKFYKFHWFQAIVTGGFLKLMEANSYDDADYFELEDMPSLALSINMLTLYPKIYNGEISLDSTAF